jgi:predicted MarR family transcription regulator
MKDGKINPGLARALALSQEMLAAAEQANLQSLELLDAERLELLKSFRLEVKQVNAADRALLEQISQINDQTIGLLEHQRRGKGRDMDMAAVGRRAVAAYSSIRLQR